MPAPRPPEPPRLIDLRIDWLAQYAPETDLFGPSARDRGTRDLPRIEGYLGATSAAVLVLVRDPEDWARQPDPWRALGTLIARAEAEFSGRLLLGRDDLIRWREDRDGLTWGVLAVGGLEALVRSPADLDRLPALFARGVRVFQPIAAGSGPLGDAQGLTGLGHACLERLVALGSDGGPQPSLDLAGMGPAAVGETLAWFEADPGRACRLIPFRSHGSMDADEVRRTRALGGLVGLGASSRSFDSIEALRRALEGLGTEGIGLATDAFGGGAALAGVETAPSLAAWAVATLGLDGAMAILRGHAEAWIARCVGG